MKILITLIIILFIVYLILWSLPAKEVHIKNLILSKIKPINHTDKYPPEYAIDMDPYTEWRPEKEIDDKYVLGFDFNKPKKVSKVQITSPVNSNWTELNVRNSDGKILATEKNTNEIITCKIEPPFLTDKIYLDFNCFTEKESEPQHTCAIREINFYESVQFLDKISM